ncbi:WXG100-like domain-containing protein [Streptomyces sp. NPDC054842]
MSMMPSPEVNAMIFILTGERLIDADEDLAYESRRPYSGLGRKLDRMSSLIEKSVHDIAEVMPDDLAKSYAKAMGMLIDDGGKNYLRDFAEQLDKIAEGRRKTSMDIMESKWQVIAEVIRLLIEIALYLAMSFFTGGASASQIMMAKLRSRFMILTTLSHLLQRLHLAPSLTEAFAEAFTTFAVRLAMMNFAPNGRRPDGFDWNDILKSAAFGAAAGFLTSIFDDLAKNIVKSYDNNFLKNGPDLNFKNNPNLKNPPNLDIKNNGPNPRPDPDPTPNPHDNTPKDRPEPTPYGNGPDGSRTPVTFRNDPLSFRNNTNLWRNNQILRHNADRPGAVAGHYGLKGTADFLAAGSGEALAEILIKGAFDGDWSTNWSTFVGAGLSSQVEATLSDTALNTGAELRHAIDKLSNPPTVSGGSGDTGSGTRDPDSARSHDDSDRTDGASGTDTPGPSGGSASAGPSPSPSSATRQGTGTRDFAGVDSPPPSSATGDLPPYTSVDPPAYTPGPLPVTAAENELWQQIHTGTADVREQALLDLAAVRGSQQPGSTEIGVRDSLHDHLSQVPEVRVVPAGNSPAAQVDTDAIRRALDAFGTPVTVDSPLTSSLTTSGFGDGASPETVPGSPVGESPAPGRGTGPVTSGGTANSAADDVGSGSVSGAGTGPGTVTGSSSGTGAGTSAGTGTGTGTGPGARPSGVPTGAGGQNPTGAQPSGTRSADVTASAEGSKSGSSDTSGTTEHDGPTTTSDDRPRGTADGGSPASSSPQSADSPGTTGSPDVSSTPDGGSPSVISTSSSQDLDSDIGHGTSVRAETGSAPVVDVDAGPPPKVGTSGSYADTDGGGEGGDVRDAGDGRDAGFPGDVKAGPPSSVTDPSSTSARPLTIVVSQVPPPGEGAPEAAELLDGAGVDRAVVLGPAVTPDGSGRPVRAAVELTREAPGAPVRVRTLHGPPTAVMPDGTLDTSDAAFPGADVLLPLADALGPGPATTGAPVTQGEVRTDSGPALSPTSGPVLPQGGVKADSGPITSTITTPAVQGGVRTDSGPAPATRPKLVSDASTADDGGTGRPRPADTVTLDTSSPDTFTPASATADTVVPNAVAPAPAKLATLSRPWSETATDLHLESGNSDAHGGRTSGPGPDGGRGRGDGGTPPPPPTDPDNGPATPATPPGVLPHTGRIVVRAADGGPGTGNGNGPARPPAEPAVTTLDGHRVPLTQLRRLVPETSVGPRPGRAVQTVTISQSAAEDGTAHEAGRRALLGQDTFRGVRTTSAGPSPAVSQPPVPRTVFTGPPAPLPGSGTDRGADYFVGHATSRTVTLGTDDVARPTVKVSGVQLGEVLKRWARDGDDDRPLVLFSCETGRQPEVAGLPVAQHVANRTGRQVYAPTTEVGTARDADGNVRAVLSEGPDGPGAWKLFTPEPAGTELDALARDAGLHTGPDPADPFTRARTLQQIRTLRDVLGTDAEQRPENRELLAGLAYVDGLRWLSPDTAARYGDGRMTPDLLRRMAADRARVTGTATGDAATGPSAARYTEFLSAAAGLRRTAGPDTTLDALLPPPPPALPPDTPVLPEDVRGLAYAPSAQITWSLSSTPLPLSELGLSAEDTAELARRRPDLAPAPGRAESLAEDTALLSKTAPPTADTVRADGLAFRRLETPGGGNCLFRSLLDSARGQDVPPAWAARNVAGLRGLLRDRITGSELGDTVSLAIPDPVFAVVDDLRMRAVGGVRDEAERNRLTEHWNRIARDVVTGADAGEWQRILAGSDYPQLAAVAPTPAAARRLGARGLVAAAAELPALWSSPFADLLPEALAHTLDLDLRLVQPDPQSPGTTFVNTLNPGGRTGTLHLSYNGTDHYDALVPASAPLTPVPDQETAPDPDPVTAPEPIATQDTAVQDEEASGPLGEWLRSMGGITDLDAPATEAADRGDLVPLETQLDRHRPARLLTGEDARPPGPVPSTVTFEDGSRLPALLINPDADPGDGTPGRPTDGSPRGRSTGLFTGPGMTTLRSPEQVAEEILGKLPKKLRAQFDEAELLRLLIEQPAAFTAPRGARFVGREKSGVGHEMTVEAIPYHRWERFSDVNGGTVRLDTMRRGQAGTGGGRSVGFGRRIAGGLSMGPPLNWLLKIGVSLGWTRRTDYAQGTQAYNQSEWRAHEGSHLHLDDVHYRVRVDRVTEAPGSGRTGTPPGPGNTVRDRGVLPKPDWQRTQVHTAEFAMRDGLSWRLPDDLTVPYKGPRRAPRTLTFPDGVEPRITDITGLHLLDPPEDMALAISGARPGSSAHRTLISYVRPGRLLALFGRFAGPVTGPELTRGGGQHPLGHLIVQASVPHRATLVTESVKAELRDLTQTTYQNERGHVRDTRLGLQVTAGPNYTLIGPDTDVRLQGGPLVRADVSAGRGHYLGVDAARKTTGRVRNHPIALYRVERTLMVRKPGEPASAARPVRVVTLDWISTQDARRLAGWDSRTPGRTGPHPDAEPPVPWYLTREDPVHLSGQVRAEGFRPLRPQAQLPSTQEQSQSQPRPPVQTQQEPPQTRPSPPQAQNPPTAPQDPMRAFADTVLDTLHQAYPSLFVPPFMLRHPRLAKFWYGDGRMRTALHNDRQVREALNRPSLAQSLDDLTTTGVPVTLTEDGKVRRGHHTLILRARLTDRRFETTMSERSLRNAVIGTEISGQGQQASLTLSGGVELGVSPRDHDKVPDVGLPRQAGNVTVGVRHAKTDQKATRNTVAVAHDQLTFQTGADLYSYQVELGASFEGHRRPRGWARLVSVGLLGAGVFVSKVEERPLFSRGNETVGRVELAVPAAHGSERYAPADPPPAATPAATAPRQLTATEADQLLDGTRPSPTTDSPDERLTRRLLSVPHVVLSAEGGPQRQQLMQDTADRASGTSWHVSAPGAPVRGALRRAMANLSVAGQLGQYLGPFGSRVAGLNGAGPFRTHYLKAAVRGELRDFRVMSDPKPASLEATIGNEHRVAGSTSTVSRTTVGLQGADMPLQQAPGQAAVVGSYSTALQYAWGKGRSVSQTLTRGRNTTLTYAGRMYLVVADAVETVAVRDRWTAAMGAVGTRAGARISSAAGRLSGRLGDSLAPRRAAAALHRIRDAVMFHLPMQDAIEAGLAPDGLGTGTPHNLGRGYRLPPYLRHRRFPSHPSGRLDAGPAAQGLLDQLERIGVPSHDREQVLQRLSPDFLRAHLHELTTDGMNLPVRYRAWSRPHHLPVGGSPGQLHFALTPVTTTVDRLRTGFELEDYRTIARDDAGGTSQDRGADVTLSAGQRAAESGILVANPSLQGIAAKQRASTRTQTAGTTSMPNIATTQAHAEIVTSYVLTVTMTDATGDPLDPGVRAPVGSLNEILPANLLTPDGEGADGALSEQDVPEPERAVRLLTADQARPENIGAWRASGDGTGGADPDVLPFDDRIGSGILAVDVRGAANVRDALTLATARADGLGDGDLGRRHTGDVLGARVRMARQTPLTGLGTASAQAQQEATAQGGLTAAFREALGANGSPLPAQASARLLGQYHTADSRLYAKMHRRGARLLAVENKPRMEAMQRAKTSDALEAGITDNVEGAVGTAPMAGNSNAGVTNPGATVPIGGTNDGTVLKGTADTTLGTHLKVVTDRSMLFAVPVTWLSVAEVDHRITDSRPLHALGKARRGPRAAEAETTALVWLREDIARDYGLLDDTTFPDEVLAAWDSQAKAAADLATAEKNYYDARARAREAWLDLSPAERTALGDDNAGPPADLPPDVIWSPGVVAWQAARQEVHRWEQHTDAAAQDHHRLHLAASRLTAHHQGSAAAPVRDLPQEYTEPSWRSEAPAPYVITDGTGTAPRTLTSPDGATVRDLHDVPHDGASFFHALLAAAAARGRLPHLLGHDLAGRFASAPGDPAVTAEAVDTARTRLAWALGEDSNQDLLDALALDADDTFTQAELDLAGVEFSPAQQAEFDAFGRLPQTFWPTPAQRVALATAALSRPFASEPPQDSGTRGPVDEPAPPERRAGDHGGADLLPALAARVLGTPLTVVTGEGRDQLFLPHGADPASVDPAADPVLFASEGFFHAALPPGTPAPAATALPAATDTRTASADPARPTPEQPPAHRSHTTAPWLPPADGSGPRYRLDRDGVLTAPDGATWTQGTPAGRGNGFFGALSTTLRQAAQQPGLDRQEAARLRRRAEATPAQLMRLNGLPGDRAERDALFTPPPLRVRPGAPAPSQDALDGQLRRHLAEAPWGPDADRAVAEWAAAAAGVTVTLVEENGTAHTYAGPAGDSGPHLRLRRRGGDFVPLTQRTPAPAPKTPAPAPETPAPKAPESKAPEPKPSDPKASEPSAVTAPEPLDLEAPETKPLELKAPESEEVESRGSEAHAETSVDTAAPVPPVPDPAHQDPILATPETPAPQDPTPAAPATKAPASAEPLPPREPASPDAGLVEAVSLPLPPPSPTGSDLPGLVEEEAYELSTLSGADAGPDAPAAPVTAPQPVPRPFKLGNYEFTNLNQTERYLDKAVRIIQLLDEHGTIKDYVGDRTVRITLHLRTTETPADVRDLGENGVQINLASYYFEKYDIGYIMGMLAHEIGLHPLASRNPEIPEQEQAYQGMPLTVPGLSDLDTPRTMNTDGAGQADHIMAAYPRTIRHGIYRDIVVDMAKVLAQHARVGVPGAKYQDVTDLFETYLMDLASIAVTSDYRMNAVREPNYTARVYNAYKEMLRERLADDTTLRNLLPSNKTLFGVARSFTQLATSIAANNRGDSIQRPAPVDVGTTGSGEARPRLPRGGTESELRTPPPRTPRVPGPRDNRPRFVVRSGFDVRRFPYRGEPVTELTVRVALRGTEDQATGVFNRLRAGVEEFLNSPSYRLPGGDRLHVTVEHVDPSENPHLTVTLAGRDRAMDQNTWWTDAAPVQFVHELTHQLGLRDEYRDADSPHRPHVLGSLLGDLGAAPEDTSLAPAGLRDRHLALLGALIGDVTPTPLPNGEDDERSWEAAREAAVARPREAVWIDPVSLPRTTDDPATTEVPAHMPGETDPAPAPEPVPRPFKLGRFEFTNLNQTDRYLDKAVRIIGLLDEHTTIRNYVGDRTVRITLHVRTTETPADVRDLGEDGVEINLASYYFEKYEVGYIMGMLAHEIGLHPLASRNERIPEEEDLYQGMPLLVPGLEELATPRFMNTEGAGQADHVMAAFPHTIRHGVYRDIVLEMAEVLARHARVGVNGAKPKDVTDLIDTYLMDLASIAVTNDHRAQALREPAYTARVYNAYKAQLAERIAQGSPVRALLPGDKGRFGVLGDFAALATSIGTNNRGDSIQRPAVPAPAAGTTGEARPRLPQSDTGLPAATGVAPRMQQNPDTARTAPEPALVPFTSGNFQFTNLKHTEEKYRDKAVRIIGVLRRHDTIREYVGGRPVRITLHVRTTETPADVTDLGEEGVQINLASYYFEKYDVGYIMGMLAHEIGLHPLASRDRGIPDEEGMFAGMPLTVPGLTDLKTPRMMNTEGAGQADHIMAAYPSGTRHRIYRDIVLDMAHDLAAEARDGEEGAREQDVTNLIDCYLMDLATIALTNDRRKDAAWEPRYTAKVYNAYKELFAARLAPDSPVRRLLPKDKSWYNVTGNFLGLGSSLAFNNQGDSMQTAALTQPAGDSAETRSRLPRQNTGTTAQDRPSGTARPAGPRDDRPRFVVRSGFDVRRFTYDGDPVTDLTVRVALRGPDDQADLTFHQLAAGVAEFLNAPGHRLPNGDLLHVSVEHVDPSEAPHLTVDLTGRDRTMDQNTWWADAEPVQLVHELTHQLGLRDEYRDADAPHRPHIPGSLLGDLDAAPEHLSLRAAGLRGRHLALLGALIGDVPRTSEPSGRKDDEQTWDALRTGTDGVPRESVWVDPVSLPRRSADGTADARGAEGTDVPARMPQDPDAVPASAAAAHVPFSSGNIEFTNLAHTNERYRDKAIRIIDLLRRHDTIREYVGGRPVRITLHVRTTETPADVTDLGEEGVRINLASYYFEKYAIGHIMGMLAHEIGLHPLASRNTKIPEEEDLYRGMPLLVPGLDGLSAPRFMNTEGAGQADHVMAAFPHSIRHGIYRDIVLDMARVLADDARAGEDGATAQDVTDLIDCYLMDLASIALTNDHRTNAAREPGYTARVYNAYKELFREQLAKAAPDLRALLPSDKSMFGVMNDFRRIATYVAIGNSGDSIQRTGRA